MERVNEETGAKLAAYLMNELDGAGRAEVEAILAASPEAREELEELRGAFQFLSGEMTEKDAAPALAAARVEAIKSSASAGEKPGAGANGSSARVLAVAPKRRVSRARWLGYAAAASAAGVLTWAAVQDGLEDGFEYQVRSKVARAKSDQRSMAVSMESYYVEPHEKVMELQTYSQPVPSEPLLIISGGMMRSRAGRADAAPADQEQSHIASSPAGPKPDELPAATQSDLWMSLTEDQKRKVDTAMMQQKAREGDIVAQKLIDIEKRVNNLSTAPSELPSINRQRQVAEAAPGQSSFDLAAAAPPQATPASPPGPEILRIIRGDGRDFKPLEEGLAAGQPVQFGLQFEAAPPGQVADASGRRRDHYFFDSNIEARSGSYIVEQGPPAPAGPMPRDMFFQNYGVNPFIDAAEDAQSTFAIDVDTASYTIVRNYLNRGMLPPPEAVRVEEIVNYLPNRYAAPKGETFAVYSELAPSPFRKGYHVLKVGIKGREARKAERKPMAITFVIDVSGSMAQENRLELVKATLSRLLGQLRPQDRVAIAVYGTNGRRVLPHTGLDQRWQIEQAISQLVPEGSTNAGEGLQIGYAMAREGFIHGGVNRVLLCSDGVANNGITDPNQILQVIGENAGNNVYLTTIGYGMGNYNDVLMEQLADKGNGHYAYIDSGREMEAFVDRKLVGSFDVIAQDMKIQVEFEPAAVEKYRLLGYENREVPDAQFRNDRIDAGEIGAGHAATALYEVKLAPGAAGRAATVRLRFKQPEAGMTVKEIAGEIEIGGAKETFAAADEHTKLVAVAAQYADILRRSHWARESSMSDVERVFGEAGLRAASGAEAIELGGLISAAARMMPPLSDEPAAQAEEFEEENAPAADGGRRVQMK